MFRLAGAEVFAGALLSSHTQMSSATPRRSMLKRCSCCAAVLDALILHATGRHLQSPPPRVECRRKCKRQKMHCTKQWAHGRYRSCRCYIMQAHRKLGANLPAPMKSSRCPAKGRIRCRRCQQRGRGHFRRRHGCFHFRSCAPTRQPS